MTEDSCKFIADKIERIDIFLAEKTCKSRSAIKKLIDDGCVTVNGEIPKAGKILKVGEMVEYIIPEPKMLDLEPKNLPLDIIFQDKDVAVINKAQGVTVHAGNGTHGSTLVNALLYHLDCLSGINGVIRPGIVHRIDKDTSGLLVVAKNDEAHLSLSAQIKDKTCSRIYYALVEGVVKDDKGRIETCIGRSDKNRTMMAVTERGRIAITDYEVVKRYSNYTLMKFALKTGRTHQIRVHCKYMGHPIVGDPVYGYKNQKFKLNGQLLHAAELSFNHPRTGERMTFRAPFPDYFENILKVLGKR